MLVIDVAVNVIQSSAGTPVYTSDCIKREQHDISYSCDTLLYMITTCAFRYLRRPEI